MCGKKLALLLLLYSLVLPLWSESSPPSFEPEATYQVTGAELNKLSKDLATAQKSLTDSQAENAQLKKDSTDKQEAYKQLQKQLQTVSQSFQKSQNEALLNDVWIAGGGVAVGVILTLVLTK